MRRTYLVLTIVLVSCNGTVGPMGVAGDKGAMGEAGAMGTPGSANALVSTVIVSPAADATASGTALLAALAGITTASANTPILLKLEPGVYDLGTGSLTMKPFVDVEGSGLAATRVTAHGTAATVDSGTSSAELRT